MIQRLPKPYVYSVVASIWKLLHFSRPIGRMTRAKFQDKGCEDASTPIILVSAGSGCSSSSATKAPDVRNVNIAKNMGALFDFDSQSSLSALYLHYLHHTAALEPLIRSNDFSSFASFVLSTLEILQLF